MKSLLITLLSLLLLSCTNDREFHKTEYIQGVEMVEGVEMVDSESLHDDFLTTIDTSFTHKILMAGIKKAEEEYLNEAVPIVFMIPEDGEYANWWRCTENCTYHLPTEIKKAKEHCEARSTKNQQCYVHYIGREKINKNIQYKKQLSYRVFSSNNTISIPSSKAKGKILYFPGSWGWKWKGNPNIITTSNTDYTSYLLRKLNKIGWDIDRVYFHDFERAQFKSTGSKEYKDTWHNAVKKIVDKYKKEGFDKIYLFGKSRGGAEVLWATSKQLDINGIMLMEPDFLGKKLTLDGKLKEMGRVKKIGPLIKDSKTNKIVFALFKNSTWYGNIDGNDFKYFMGSNKQAWILNKPKGYAGHSASQKIRFSNEFLNCFDEFLLLDEKEKFKCIPNKIDNSKIENWATKEHLILAGLKPFTSNNFTKFMRNKKLCSSNKINNNGKCTVFGKILNKSTMGGYRVIDNQGNSDSKFYNMSFFRYTNSGYCEYDKMIFGLERCLEAYRKDDIIFLVDNKNTIRKLYAVKLSPLKKHTNIFISDDFEGGGRTGFIKNIGYEEIKAIFERNSIPKNALAK
jgi:hypothetical protein